MSNYMKTTVKAWDTATPYMVEMPEQPFNELQVLQEIYRLQEVVLCSCLTEQTRFIMASLIDMSLIMVEVELPGHVRPHRFTRRQ